MKTLLLLLVLWISIAFSASLPTLSPKSDSFSGKGRSARQAIAGLIFGWMRSYERILGDPSCSFGDGPDEGTFCAWTLSNLSALYWELSYGINSNWIGGPPIDASDSPEGGYVLFETSQIPNISGRTSQSAVLEGPPQTPSSALGLCLSFNYAMEGLSPDKIRVLLHPIQEQARSFRVDGHVLSLDGVDHGADVVLWESGDSTNGLWRAAEVVYTSRQPHQIYLEGIPRDPSLLSRRYRGFIAVDNVNVKSAEYCPGHCNFDGGFCDWTNEEDDDLDWSLARGSQNPSTGPIMDRASYTHGGNSGGYAVIHSSFPARAGDKARLSSREFSRTGGDKPLCMRFWTHMYGNGIGTLKVLLYDTEGNEDRVVWSLSGEAGNAWYQGQIPISSFSPFKIVFEAEVGKNNLGDIAIDDISFAPGACPSAPQTAAPTSGDCTFEVDECGWTNVLGSARTDEMDWERRLGQNARTPMSDHTLGSPTGNFMTLSALSVQRAGDRAWMVSPVLEGFKKPRCLSFWYYMNEPFTDTTGPSLGGLKIYTRSVAPSGNDLTSPATKLNPIWRLYNQQAPVWKYAQARLMETEPFQVVYEGIHGSSRANGFIGIDDIAYFEGDCTTLPVGGFVSVGECSFEKDMCRWRNESDDPLYKWRLATITRRPANLPDKTFGAPVGYVYFDIFSQNGAVNPVRLTSPPLAESEEEEELCFSFWYAGFGAGESTFLRILALASNSEDDSGQGGNSSQQIEIWSLSALELDTVRPEWRPGQVTFSTSTVHRISLEGQATNGGFAVDDISITKGECTTRPAKAATNA